MDKKAVVVSQFKFDADPRHHYWSSSLQNRGYRVTEIELLQLPERRLNPVQFSRRANRLSVFHWSDRTQFLELFPTENRELCLAPNETAIGKYLEKILTSCTLSLHLVRAQLEEADVLVANDLIPAVACLLSGLTANYLIYDAQEFFAASYDVLGIKGLSDSEKEVWNHRESVVASKFTKRISISTEGCQIMKGRTGHEFQEIPNCIPMERIDATHQRLGKFEAVSTKNGPVRYVFLGRAEPNRGLEQLIDAWDFSPEVATLSLFVPESAHKQKLLRRSRKQRKSTSVLFPPPIPNSQVISELSAYDIGIIPYLYQGDYAYATPTKFGEYVAAGLPTLVSSACKTVVRLVETHGIGLVGDFQSPELLRRSIAEMNSVMLTEVQMIRNTLQFREHYVWEAFFDAVVGDDIPSNTSTKDNCGITGTRSESQSAANQIVELINIQDLEQSTFANRVRAKLAVLQLSAILALTKRTTRITWILSRL